MDQANVTDFLTAAAAAALIITAAATAATNQGAIPKSPACETP